MSSKMCKNNVKPIEIQPGMELFVSPGHRAGVMNALKGFLERPHRRRKQIKSVRRTRGPVRSQ